MDLPVVLQNLGLVLGAGFVGALLARFFRLPVMVGYLFGGVVIGVLTAGRLAGDATLSGLANFGVAMLLFSLGVELSFGSLGWSGVMVVLLAITQVMLTMAVVILGAVVFGIDWGSSVFLGAALSLSSTAVVVKLLEASGRAGTIVGEISVVWMLVQDLMVVPFFFLLPLVSGRSYVGEPIWVMLVKTAAVLLFVGLIGRRVGKIFLRGLAKTDTLEILLLGLVVWVLASATISIWLGLTMSLGVFLGGVMLGHSNHEAVILSVTRPIRDLFAVIFFTSLGLFLSPAMAFKLIIPTVLVSLLILLVKFLISAGLLTISGYHLRLAFDVAAPMSGVGEFAFLVMGLGRSLGIVSEDVFALTVSLALFSIAATPAFSFAVEKGLVLLFRRLPRGVYPESRNDGFYDHVVLCGFGRVGSWVGEALAKENVDFTVVDYHVIGTEKARAMGAKSVVYGDATRSVVLDRAGVRRAAVVVVTIPSRENQRTVIRYVREVNPRALIVARAEQEKDRRELGAFGAQAVIQPEFEASLSIVHRVLQAMGRPKERVAREIKLLKMEFEERV